jgi:putative FmdB family regulatory protein
MPTYELVCHDCGHRFEKFLMRLLRDEDCVCPACGSAEVKRGVGGVLGSARGRLLGARARRSPLVEPSRPSRVFGNERIS